MRSREAWNTASAARRCWRISAMALPTIAPIRATTPKRKAA
ncbi:MAG: hypothetical protein R2702_03730 [Acidimicrobiales bacterium]